KAGGRSGQIGKRKAKFTLKTTRKIDGVFGILRIFFFTGIKERQSLYNLWNRCYTAYRPIKTKVKKFARFDG
ncbi:hypothetical protein, partial [Hominenteromicrobium sp.]|uniref:hypothetical protein n=1 Tax=Hominenteromicrobium sp. TaxID=3073581 RepID=UPI003A8FD7B6